MFFSPNQNKRRKTTKIRKWKWNGGKVNSYLNFEGEGEGEGGGEGEGEGEGEGGGEGEGEGEGDEFIKDEVIKVITKSLSIYVRAVYEYCHDF